jgi:acetoin utilization deacetylase AcuC-like enzyme
MNKTAYITHPIFLQHDTGNGHPEAPQRLIAIQEKLKDSGLFDQLIHYQAPLATDEQLERAHDKNYLHAIEAAAPATENDSCYLDQDTRMSYHSLEAAKRAAGAVVLATEQVLTRKIKHAFCSVRPPGHHAKRNRSMGFCIYNNAMIGIYHALAHGLNRVALLDFDVHHGNGSENIIAADERILFCSTFQHPYYPNESFKNNDHILCSGLTAGAGSAEFRHEVKTRWIPALDQFKPEMIFVSAGFDAHQDDYLADLDFTTDDYGWVAQEIAEVAERYCQGRVVSTLEGGYNTESLAASVETYLRKWVVYNESQ